MFSNYLIHRFLYIYISIYIIYICIFIYIYIYMLRSSRWRRSHYGGMTNEWSNFRAFVKMRIKSWDENLWIHWGTCSRSAAFLSKTIQNKLLSYIKQCIETVYLNLIKNQLDHFSEWWLVKWQMHQTCSNWN